MSQNSQGCSARSARVRILRENLDFKISIEGHTDNTGTPDRDIVLSQQGAESVVSAFMKAAIGGKRLNAKGWRQDKPIADNETEEGRAENRRLEIVMEQ